MVETQRDPDASGSSPDPSAIDRAVAAFQAGENPEESFRVLFEAYYRRVRAFFARRTDGADDCLDLTQETFLRAYQGLGAFRGDAPFGAWLYAIARNVHRARVSRASRWRKSASIAAHPEDDEAPPPRRAADALVADPQGLETVLDAERRRLLRSAVQRLPEQRRKCIVLWAYHGLTYEQIAVVLRLALGTVKAHLAQARAQLGELVAQEPTTRGGDHDP